MICFKIICTKFAPLIAPKFLWLHLQKKNKWRAQVRKKGISKSAEFNTKTEAQRWALAIETQIDN
ncbi:hypothetical protein GEW_13101, partial [Pasteurella multocida subsp. gallicida str. Anand1_poultry]